MDTELAYLAGFFDGEGCISIVLNNRSGALTLTVSISQLDPQPLILCQKRFGGSLHRERDHRGFRTRVSWQTASRLALAALEQLRPYLIVKADEADIGIAFQRRVMDWTGEDKQIERDFRLKMREDITALKQRVYDGIELPKTEQRTYDHSGPRLRMKVKPKPPVKHREKIATPVKSTGYDQNKMPGAEMLAEVYRDIGLSLTARNYGVSRQTILNWLDRYGIPRQGRTPASEARRKAAVAASWKSSSSEG